MQSRLRERVTLQQRATVNDGGAVLPTFVAVAPQRVQAQVSSPVGQRMEGQFGSQVTAMEAYQVTMRTWDAVRLEDRLLWHTRTGDVLLEVRGKAYLDEPMRHWMVLTCEARDL